MAEDVQQASHDQTAISRFRIGFPEAELTELRRATDSRPRRPLRGLGTAGPVLR